MTSSEFVELTGKANSMDDVSNLIFKVFDEKEALEQRIIELEEEKENLPLFSSASDKRYIELMEQRIEELEEPLSCLGCKHDGRYEYCKTMECIRLFTLDNYEPKD